MPHGLHSQLLVTLNTVAQETRRTSLGPFFRFPLDLGSTSKINVVQKKKKKKKNIPRDTTRHESFSCSCCRSAAAAIPAAAAVPAGVDEGGGDGRCGKEEGT